MTIPELLDQPWTKRAARIASFIAVLMFGSAIGYFFSLGNRITAIESDRAIRIIALDRNNAAINSRLADLSADLDRVRSDVVSVKVEVGTVKGILQQMQREQAVHMSLPPQSQQMPLVIARSD